MKKPIFYTITLLFVVTSAHAACPTLTSHVNVIRYGAKANGITVDNLAIQKAMDTACPRVIIPDGVYLIDAASNTKTIPNLTPKPGQSIIMSARTILKVKANSHSHYAVFDINGVISSAGAPVKIIGGFILGDRKNHIWGSAVPYVDNEYGHGIRVVFSKNVLIQGVTVSDMWGDGIYIGDNSSNITVDHVTSNNNRRQGLTITGAKSIIVKNSQILNTSRGTPPYSGIDIEPNEDEVTSNIKIIDNLIANNDGFGIIGSMYAAGSKLTNLKISGNTIMANGNNFADFPIESYTMTGAFEAGIGLFGREARAGVAETKTSGHIITNNKIIGNLQSGILLELTTGITITNNAIVNNGFSSDITGNNTKNNDHLKNGYGLEFSMSTRNRITNNRIVGNARGTSHFE